MRQQLSIAGLAYTLGDIERSIETLEQQSVIGGRTSLKLHGAGCRTFYQMTGQIDSHVARCVSESLSASGVSPDSVDRLIIAAADQNLPCFDAGTARNLLSRLGLRNCVPALMSLQQCTSSLAAIDYGWSLFADASIRNVVVVAVHVVTDDKDRVTPFALFGDAVSSCVITRDRTDHFALLSHAVRSDFEGLTGQDTFDSRKVAATSALQRALDISRTGMEEIECFFATNLYKPVASYHAAVCGIDRRKLFIDTLPDVAHCGPSDWMMNLIRYREAGRLVSGRKYVIQSSAPAFHACSVIQCRSG